ncbi:hypothetical protein ACE1CI_10570 [Aerosakkonemataceae cyanobacterium BLCC-F50]|uniref:Uncharacterized protein n=1 Tax=Floridaenema flaviceps BLCC-F50 TaxID=3153642 RepID=A0ABV4XP80_9CYAN
MTLSITQNLQTFLEDLKSADLVGISLLPQNLGLRLDFTFGPEANDVSIAFSHIIHLVLSQPINASNEEFCFWVGEVELRELESDGKQILSTFSYPFKNQNGTIDVNSSSLIYFRLVGDLCLEIVCDSYQIVPEVSY